MKFKIGSPQIWMGIGALFLLYAFVGNYTTLPGYLRFLERGGVSESGSASDSSVIVGAIKTIIWLFSFQLGIFFVFLGTLKAIRVSKRQMWLFALGFLVWLMIAGIPKLPGPFALFFALGGLVVLLLIIAFIAFWTKKYRESRPSSPALFKVTGYLFFALVSWDVCGLGSMGRILHLETAFKANTEPMLITQMTKIMVEFILAWGFTLVGYVLDYRSKNNPEKTIS